jgi:hypothetical protein
VADRWSDLVRVVMGECLIDPAAGDLGERGVGVFRSARRQSARRTAPGRFGSHRCSLSTNPVAQPTRGSRTVMLSPSR